MDIDWSKAFRINGIDPPNMEPKSGEKPYYPRPFFKHMQLVLYSHNLRLAIYHFRLKYKIPLDVEWFHNHNPNPNHMFELGKLPSYKEDIERLLLAGDPPFSPVFLNQICQWAAWGLWMTAYHPRERSKAEADMDYLGGYIVGETTNVVPDYIQIRIYNQLSAGELEGLKQFIKTESSKLPPKPNSTKNIPKLSRVADIDRLYKATESYKKSGKNQVIANIYNEKYKPEEPLGNEEVREILEDSKRLGL